LPPLVIDATRFLSMACVSFTEWRPWLVCGGAHGRIFLCREECMPLKPFTPSLIEIHYFPTPGGIGIKMIPAKDDIGTPPPQNDPARTYEPQPGGGIRKLLGEVIDKILVQRRARNWVKISKLNLDDAEKYLTYDPGYSQQIELQKMDNEGTTIRELYVTYSPLTRVFRIEARDDSSSNTPYFNRERDKYILFREVLTKIWFCSTNGTKVKLTIDNGDVVATPTGNE
jgi:hypothetical protein